MSCKICDGIGNLRLGACFDCAEAESIIEDGTDMYDKPLAKTSMEKLQALIKLGWHIDGKVQQLDK